ncbi:MAG: YcdB/YcdC domain-containing protein [Clostridia bacterium]
MKHCKLAAMMLASSLLFATPIFAQASHQQHDHNQIIQSINTRKIPDEMKLALEKLYVILPQVKKLEIVNVEIRERQGSTGEWHFSLESKKSDRERVSAEVTIDSDTGKLLGYTYRDWKRDGKPLSEKRAKQLASKFLDHVVGEDAGLYQFSGIWGGRSAVVDGITYTVILGRLGEVEKVEINIGADFSQLPENHDILSPEEAAQIYVKASELSLAYVIDRQGTIDTSTQAPKLLFIPKHGGRAAGVDAFTGEMVFIR